MTPQALFYATLPPWSVVIIAVVVLLTLAWAIILTADKSLKRDYDPKRDDHAEENKPPRHTTR